VGGPGRPTHPCLSNVRTRDKLTTLYASFICACIDHLADSVNNIIPEAWCEKQLEEMSTGTNVSGVAVWEAIYKRMIKFQTMVNEKQGLDNEPAMMEFLRPKIQQSYANLATRYRASNVVTEGRTLLTFAMEEARSLLDSYGGTIHFSIFRWMASCLKDRGGIFIILLDTASEVNNFMSTTVRDGSYRYISRSNQLLPPFYIVNTFNILASKRKIWNDLGDSRDMTLVLTSHFMKGRPLFGSYIQSGLNVEVKDVVRLAVEKLLGGITVRHNMELTVDIYTAVALLSVRAAVFVKPQEELASYLVASHLTWLPVILAYALRFPLTGAWCSPGIHRN
jgi:hypothetical protein